MYFAAELGSVFYSVKEKNFDDRGMRRQADKEFSKKAELETEIKRQREEWVLPVILGICSLIPLLQDCATGRRGCIGCQVCFRLKGKGDRTRHPPTFWNRCWGTSVANAETASGYLDCTIFLEYVEWRGYQYSEFGAGCQRKL